MKEKKFSTKFSAKVLFTVKAGSFELAIRLDIACIITAAILILILTAII